ALYVRKVMTLNNEIVLKSLIGYGLFFFIIWLVLAGVLIFSGSAEFSVRGLGFSFLVLQVPTLVLVIKTKLRLSKSAIK
ncbi:hypothetical protein WG68_18835, partial [Arsukibacterium ikkense]